MESRIRLDVGRVKRASRRSPGVSINADEYRSLVKSWTAGLPRRAAFPRKLKARLTALHFIREGFEPGRSYSEDEANSTIGHFNVFKIDHVQIRRQLVDCGLLRRNSDGTNYKSAREYLDLAGWDPDIPGIAGQEG